MKDLLDKLSSYNIFNYLLPGVVFVVLADLFTSVKLVQDDIVVGVFLYYFIGLIISRVGSIMIEPFLKWVKFIRFSDYGDFVAASKSDVMLSTISEANNMYRTFISLFVSLVAVKGYDNLLASYPVLKEWSAEFLIVCLLLLFLFSYRKQTEYVNKRVQKAIRKE